MKKILSRVRVRNVKEMLENRPNIITKNLRNNLESARVKVTRNIIIWALHRGVLQAYHLHKMSFLKASHLKSCLAFANEHTDKFISFSYDGQMK